MAKGWDNLISMYKEAVGKEFLGISEHAQAMLKLIPQLQENPTFTDLIPGKHCLPLYFEIPNTKIEICIWYECIRGRYFISLYNRKLGKTIDEACVNRKEVVATLQYAIHHIKANHFLVFTPNPERVYYVYDWLINSADAARRLDHLIKTAEGLDCELRIAEPPKLKFGAHKRFVVQAPTEDVMQLFIKMAASKMGMNLWEPISYEYHLSFKYVERIYMPTLQQRRATDNSNFYAHMMEAVVVYGFRNQQAGLIKEGD